MKIINPRKTPAPQLHRQDRMWLALIVITMAVPALASTVKAQTFAEWFKQKSTQRKYLLQQIAALRAYSACYKKGNEIVRFGLGSISGSLAFENALHTAYYHQLQNVNPFIKNNGQMNDIVGWQRAIITRIAKLDKTVHLGNGEKEYVMQVKDALLNDCHEQITALQNIISDNKLKMNDEERLKHIGVIHAAMQNNYRFASTFAEQVKIYVAQRSRQKNSVLTERKIYGIQSL